MAECTGTTANGTPCHKPATPGTQFCYWHSGEHTVVPGSMGAGVGNNSGNAFGIYIRGLTPQEKEDWSTVQLGNLDSEIRMAKFRLARAYEAQLVWEAAIGDVQKEALLDIVGVERELSVENTPTGTRNGVNRKRVMRRGRDFTNEITQFTRLVALLERTRIDMAQLDKSQAHYDDIAAKMQTFAIDAMGTMA